MEYGRRLACVKLMEELMKKPGWNISRVSCFLNEKYGASSGVHRTGGQFCRWLVEAKNGQGANIAAILKDTDSNNS